MTFPHLLTITAITTVANDLVLLPLILISQSKKPCK